MSKHINKVTEEEIIKLFENGESITNIGKKTNFSTTSIGSFLEKKGLRKRVSKEKESKNKFESHKKTIINKYNSGLSLRKIGLELNMKPEYVKKYLILWGIETKKDNLYNENIFEKIDTEEKAYWLGFIYADGWISTEKNRNRLGIELSIKDKEHLEKFELFVCKEKNKNMIKTRTRVDTFNIDKNLPIEQKRKTETALIAFDSKKIVNDLINLGCVQNKTFIIKFPTKEQVPEHLIRHFLRGNFDGDGCISKKTKQLTFLGTQDFCEKIKTQIEKITSGNSKVTKTKNIYRFSKSLMKKEQLLKVYNFFYKDATIFLERKRNIFSNSMPSEAENK